jgi:hypothetical protein
MRILCWTPPVATRGEDQDVACAGNVGHGLPNTPLHCAAGARRVHKADRVSNLVPGLLQGSPMNAPHPEFVRDEVIVCMLMAVCIGSAILGVIYRVMT